MLQNKKILIFGGTGSLGYSLVKRYINDNIIYNFSRDENKHWKMKLDFSHNKNLFFIIGDIYNDLKIKETLSRVNPDIVIIASAMKHIDQCELNMSECINTNLLGIKNILDSIETLSLSSLSSLSNVIFISSDKACNPINAYGMCKSLSELLVIEKSYYIKNINFCNVRYGNVLNSRGSIIQLLHEIGKNHKEFQITDERMTRFVMTLEQSVNLIEYAILNGESGDTIIPQLISMRLVDLFKIFSEKYNKPINIVGLRPGEKMYESLINETQSSRIIQNNNYYHIKSIHKKDCNFDNIEYKDYNSNSNILSYDTLKE